jgi:hypothetical protein
MRLSPIALAAAVFFTACSDDQTETSVRELQAECVRAETDAPANAWICGEERTVECNTHDGATVDSIYVVEADAMLSCTAADFSVSDPGPFPAGEHEITVARINAGDVCTSTLIVEDSEPPAVTSQTLALWPPNHKMRSIAVEDCAIPEDACDGDVEVEFTYATSDEPVNDNGDGNSEPDIIFGCDTIQVRSERMGGSNGRVYTFGWRAIDDAGNETTGECFANVPHDQSGSGATDDGEAYRIDGNACSANN